jgi:hypothetical protein
LLIIPGQVAITIRMAGFARRISSAKGKAPATHQFETAGGKLRSMLPHFRSRDNSRVEEQIRVCVTQGVQTSHERIRQRRVAIDETNAANSQAALQGGAQPERERTQQAAHLRQEPASRVAHDGCPPNGVATPAPRF